MKTATPTKLRNGTWGARVRGNVNAGETVTIATKAGASWQARIERVLWVGDGVSICATEQLRTVRRSVNGECRCGACDDLLSLGFLPGQRTRCDKCGGWAEAC